MIKNMYFFERIFAIQVSDYCEEGFDALEEQVPTLYSILQDMDTDMHWISSGAHVTVWFE